MVVVVVVVVVVRGGGGGGAAAAAAAAAILRRSECLYVCSPINHTAERGFVRRSRVLRLVMFRLLANAAWCSSNMLWINCSSSS